LKRVDILFSINSLFPRKNGFSKFSADVAIWQLGMELRKSDMIASIDTSVHKPMTHAEIVSRANYRMYSIKLHVYANVITPRAVRNPYESLCEFVRAAHVKRNCLKGNTQAGERCLTVDGFSDGNFHRSEDSRISCFNATFSLY